MVKKNIFIIKWNFYANLNDFWTISTVFIPYKVTAPVVDHSSVNFSEKLLYLVYVSIWKNELWVKKFLEYPFINGYVC